MENLDFREKIYNEIGKRTHPFSDEVKIKLDSEEVDIHITTLKRNVAYQVYYDRFRLQKDLYSEDRGEKYIKSFEALIHEISFSKSDHVYVININSQPSIDYIVFMDTNNLLGILPSLSKK